MAVRDALHARVERLARWGVRRGASPRLFRYRGITRETVQDYFDRRDPAEREARYETVHPTSVARNPLPKNVASRDELPRDRGWWGYSFWDVPERTSTETFVARIPNARIVSYWHPRDKDYYPAVVTEDGRGLDLREIRFRPPHVDALRRPEPPLRLAKATWVLERVYHNHSHWLNAHLPKLLLLKERGMLGDVLLPAKRTAAMDGSLRLLGMPPEDFRTIDVDRSLQVDELTLVGTDRFRPELLRLVPRALPQTPSDTAARRVLISRAGAQRRRLLNEDAVWTLLEPLGFERVRMEALPFEAQVELMRRTAVLVAPHGAGLTNMLFCPQGTRIVEIADLSFPNPNFYAMASALGHDYWVLTARSVGDVHPLEKDLEVDPALVREVLPAVLA